MNAEEDKIEKIKHENSEYYIVYHLIEVKRVRLVETSKILETKIKKCVITEHLPGDAPQTARKKRENRRPRSNIFGYQINGQMTFDYKTNIKW